MHHPTDRIIHTTAFVTPVVEHWLEREITSTRSVQDDNTMVTIQLYLMEGVLLTLVYTVP